MSTEIIPGNTYLFTFTEFETKKTCKRTARCIRIDYDYIDKVYFYFLDNYKRLPKWLELYKTTIQWDGTRKEVLPLEKHLRAYDKRLFLGDADIYVNSIEKI